MSHDTETSVAMILELVLPAFNAKETESPDPAVRRFEVSTWRRSKELQIKLERYGIDTANDSWPEQKPAILVFKKMRKQQGSR